MKDEQKPLRKLKPNLPFGPPSEAEREQTLQRHPEWRPIWEERKRQDALVVQALREEAHLDVQSVYDLVNTRESYPEAIPVLLRMLSVVSEPFIKSGVVRALTVKEARGIAARPLIEEFKRIEVPGSEKEAREQGGITIQLWHLKWAIGNALSVVADDSVTDEIVELLSDQRHGGTRSAIVGALLRLKPPNRVEMLLNLLQDEDDGVAIIAAGVCGRLRIQEARELIESRFSSHPDSWYRQKGKSALSKLDKTK